MSLNKHLHIISFDIPYPPVYGGIIDVFCKIKTLHKHGYKITLHCFDYKEKEKSDELEKYCEKVFYYPRKKVYQVFFSTDPYIISSRTSDELLSNLLENDYPILFEGLHTCAYINHKDLAKRNKLVWMHNIEWDYYQNLRNADKNFIHKIHFSVESVKLKYFEAKLKHAQTIFCVNQKDAEYMKKYCENSIFVPPFNLNDKVISKPGTGDYILYHGSLDVVENHQSAIYLINKIFSKIKYPVVIAGKKPKDKLKTEIAKYKNITLRADLSKQDLDELIQNAQINFLVTFQATGLKHKLINALYSGRFVITNPDMVANSGLDSLVVIVNDEENMFSAIDEYMKKPFPESEIHKREELLYKNYSNESNIEKIIPYL